MTAGLFRPKVVLTRCFMLQSKQKQENEYSEGDEIDRGKSLRESEFVSQCA